jgi:2-amino-4-hydroxy-6-hydroxymethyldihydropteridine diphosphokinase
VSHLYETQPLGPPQPDFLNGAVRLLTPLDPAQLLGWLLEIERDCGRIRRVRWGPRTLDLDILWVRGTHIQTASLVVPHPELTHRAFAILPLLDVAPDAADPLTGVLYRKLLAGLDTSGVGHVRKHEWAGPFRYPAPDS